MQRRGSSRGSRALALLNFERMQGHRCGNSSRALAAELARLHFERMPRCRSDSWLCVGCCLTAIMGRL